MKICVVQTKPVKGDIQSNIDEHKRLIKQAIAYGAEMIIFPELSLTGYEPSLAQQLATTVEDQRFADFQSLSDIHHITIGLGMPTQSATGRCISMLLFQPQTPTQIYSKKYLHADEEPFFISGRNFPVIKVEQTNIALAICYELSVLEHAQEAFAHGAELYIASVAKSMNGVEKASARLAEIASTYSVPVLMSNCVGLSEDFTSAGHTAVWNRQGELLAQLDDSSPGLIIFDTTTQEPITKTLTAQNLQTSS